MEARINIDLRLLNLRVYPEVRYSNSNLERKQNKRQKQKQSKCFLNKDGVEGTGTFPLSRPINTSEKQHAAWWNWSLETSAALSKGKKKKRTSNSYFSRMSTHSYLSVQVKKKPMFYCGHRNKNQTSHHGKYLGVCPTLLNNLAQTQLLQDTSHSIMGLRCRAELNVKENCTELLVTGKIYQ